MPYWALQRVRNAIMIKTVGMSDQSRGTLMNEDPQTGKQISHTEELIQQAEAAKAKIYDVPGKVLMDDTTNKFAHSLKIDSEYLLVGAHVEVVCKTKNQAR